MEKNYDEIVLALVDQNDLKDIVEEAPAKIRVIRRCFSRNNKNYGNIVVEIEPKYAKQSI